MQDSRKQLTGPIFAKMTPKQKEQAANNFLVETPGKRHRVNAVLVWKEIKEALLLMLDCRSDCRVKETNPHVFAIPGDPMKSIPQSAVLSKYKGKCGVINMDQRLIRHLLATMLQADPGAVETEHLANHLGHDINVHFTFYRYEFNFL